MAKRVIDISRRQVLKGIGGFTLALPVLPSLYGKTAYGADPTFTRSPRLFWLATDHGGAFESSMFPDPSMATETENLFSDHGIRHGTLTSMVEGTTRSVCPILSADGSRFTESLVSKMNVLYGLDVPFYIAHNTGLHLGNYARNDGNGDDGVAVQSDPRPTIDQIMAWSPSFYPDLSTIRERSMIMSSREVSWNYSDPSTQSGTIENVRGYQSSLELFERIFVPQEEQMPDRPPVVDHILESYRSLRNGNRRLSAADRQRLDDHIARIAELERKLTATASCDGVTSPLEDATDYQSNDPDSATRYGQLFNDVVVAAFACGTSRIAVQGFGATERFVAYSGDWHQDVAHQWQLSEAQELLTASYQRIFEGLLLDIAAKLDVEEAPGVTSLDNTLVAWSQESGMETHGSVSIPVITFGSAAGAFNTGLFVDYRRTSDPNSSYDAGAGGTQHLGVLYNQWLATVLQAMRISPSEFERWGHRGYGVPYLTGDDWTPPFRQHYGDTSSRYFQMASDPLPVIST